MTKLFLRDLLPPELPVSHFCSRLKCPHTSLQSPASHQSPHQLGLVSNLLHSLMYPGLNSVTSTTSQHCSPIQCSCHQTFGNPHYHCEIWSGQNLISCQNLLSWFSYGFPTLTVIITTIILICSKSVGQKNFPTKSQFGLLLVCWRNS